MIGFAGTYSATVDDKGRIVLPAPFKKGLGDLAAESLVIEKNIHRDCLDIHPEKFWVKRVEDFKSTLDPFDEDDDALLQYFYQMQPIYQTHYFNHLFEDQAKQNLLKMLSKK